ncbi:MAG TPA: sigma 54-interacting transcriptional regulator [Candidatus Hydrogenedentes bacterium]|nr:sigma 54-interacting transcriptional regulator [Candidatus Hydrogenedentota bacterium]
MIKFREILLDVWREACRHIDIAESTANIAQILVQHMPLGQLLVRRGDPERVCLETVAIGFPERDTGDLGVRVECTERQWQQLVAWCAEGNVVQRRGQSTFWDEPGLVFPSNARGDVLSGPLRSPGGAPGVLTLTTPPDEMFEPRHQSMAEVLLEPFAVALENDRRLREMATLREAAEADKQSLLARLGRKTLGDCIIGADSGLRLVLERVERVAQSDAPVLLLGETGTGKELIARDIHRRSGRATGPVMRVNCGAIPAELVDAQLFGHDRGAFTGASEARKGWFERADGGTLFLDEVGELPLAAQVRLLRILQDGWLERVGGRQPIHVDVRVIAATNQDLAAMVSNGTFREDLWYRIAVFPILLPPLRDRVEDIPALARHFAERAAIRFRLPVLMPSDEDIRMLASYHWPGNIRELGAVMDRAALLGNGRKLDVVTALGTASPSAPPRDAAQDNALRPGRPSPDIVPLNEVMRRHIEATLERTHGRVEGAAGAAALLAINPHTLRARMRKLGIDWTEFRTQGRS